MLVLEDAIAFHGKAQALHGVSLEVGAGEVISIIGRNGAGKTTTLRAMAGFLPMRGGRLLYDGADVTNRPAHTLSRLGINYVPDTRRIFADLTVEENLRIATFAHNGAHGGAQVAGRWTLARIYALFPRLEERRHAPGDALSGGEQQMLAIGRGLLTSPRVLMLDEPTEGLAPRIVDDLVAAIRVVQAEGLAIVLVEQKLKVPLALASRQYLIENGRVIWQGTTEALRANQQEVEALMGL
jgi:branched-chain amino acid transport system ATP-binding protein